MQHDYFFTLDQSNSYVFFFVFVAQYWQQYYHTRTGMLKIILKFVRVIFLG